MLVYKHYELSEQFQDVDQRLKFIVYAISGFIWDQFRKETMITCVYRPGTGVHAYMCGVDLRTRNLIRAEGDRVLKEFNGHTEYDPRRPAINVVHDERAPEDQSTDATEEHFHIQVWPGSEVLTLYKAAV